MARLPYPDPGSAPDRAREIFERLPVKLNVMRMMLQAPTCMPAFVRLGAAVLGQQKLDDRLREIAILRVAALSGAGYEWTQHVAIAKAVGVTEEEISAIRDGNAGALDSGAGLVVKFTNECVKDVRVSDVIFEEAKAAFSDQEIAELVITIGYYMLIARFLETLGVDMEEAPPGMAATIAAGRPRSG
ncbi:MAG: carboxymuconolactone decarboxylase family protein [Myxococcota bacterium]